MNRSIHRISLDIHKVGSQAVLNVKKGDTARSICVTLTENGRPYEIVENCSAVFSAKKPDGNFILNDCVIQGNEIVYDFTPQTAPVAGAMECEVSLYDKSGNQITSPRFLIVVDEVVYNDEEIVSSNEANFLKELISEVNSTVNEIDTKLANGEFVGEKGEKGDKGDKGDAGVDGTEGQDGVSATHEWNGTVLTVTSASGTSSADLKGEPGNDGYTPIKGVDYWTDSEQAEILAKSTPSITRQASGDTITLSDSSDLPLRDLKIYGRTEQFTTQGRNKLDLLSLIGEDYTNTLNGVTVKIENGYAVFGGTHTNTGWSNVLTATGGSKYILPAGTYTSKIHLQLKAVDDNATVGNKTGTFTIDEDAWVSSVYYAIQGEKTVSLSVPLVVAEGTQELAEYEPYTGGMPSPNPDYPQSMNTPTDVQVKVNGANILDVHGAGTYYSHDYTSAEVFATETGFAITTAKAVSNWWGRYGYYIGTKKELMGKTVTVSAKYTTSRTDSSTAKPSICLYSLSVLEGYIGNTTATPQLKLAQIENAPLTFTIDESCPYDYIGVLFLYSYGGSWKIGDWSQYDDIQVQIGDTATSFEPYTEQTLAIPSMTDIGFAGVPVKEGGNHIDANGQRWVCDEVDLSRGVYIQRVAQRVLNGTEYWEIFAGTREDGSDWYYHSEKISGAVDNGSSYSLICNQYPTNYLSNNTSWQGIGMVWRNVRIRWGTPLTIDEWKAQLAENPITIQYVLAEPIETPLDEATLSAFSALHTNKPNTTICNSSGLMMSAEYVADTKLYIDNKFAELAAAIVSNS